MGNEKRGNHKGGKTDRKQKHRKGIKTKTIMHSEEKTGKYLGNNYTKYQKHKKGLSIK